MLPRNQALVDSTGSNRLFGVIADGPAMAALYNHWAEMLQTDQDKGGGGGDGKSDGKIPPELLMALLQMIQSEQEIRSATRATHEMGQQRSAAVEAAPGASAEARQAAAAENLKAANKIGGEQVGLARELAHLLDKYDPPASNDPHEALDNALGNAVPGYDEYSGKGESQKLPPKLVELLNQTGAAMADAATLLDKGETASPTIAAETEALELLALLFDESAKQSPSQATSAMQAMMDAMTGQGQGKGKKGKGKAGNKPGMGNGGNGSVAPARNGGAAAVETPLRDDATTGAEGKTPGNIPPEYRDAIEAYHARLDKLPATGSTGGKQP